MTTVHEEWRPVAGYEGLYEVGNRGGVRSLGRDLKRVDGNRYVMPPKILRPWFTLGYPTVALSLGGRVKKVMVHRLVATAFLDAPVGDRWHVNHKDGDRENNQIANLEWVTHAENVAHAVRTGLSPAPRGEGSGKAKLSDEIVREIRASYPAVSGPKLAARYGVCSDAIYDVLSGRTWSHVV